MFISIMRAVSIAAAALAVAYSSIIHHSKYMTQCILLT